MLLKLHLERAHLSKGSENGTYKEQPFISLLSHTPSQGVICVGDSGCIKRTILCKRAQMFYFCVCKYHRVLGHLGFLKNHREHFVHFNDIH